VFLTFVLAGGASLGDRGANKPILRDDGLDDRRRVLVDAGWVVVRSGAGVKAGVGLVVVAGGGGVVVAVGVVLEADPEAVV